MASNRLRCAALISALLYGVPAWAGCTVYEHRDYGGAHWGLGSFDELQMGGGEPMGKTGEGRIFYRTDWNDKISSFRVTPGCHITLWQHAGTTGNGATFEASRSYSYVGSRWNDQASWAYCYCSN